MRLVAAILTFAMALAVTVNASNPTKVSADFKQVKSSPLQKGEKVAYGRFVYSAPDYVKWEYTSPVKKCWETSSKQKGSNPMFTTMVGIIKECVTGNFEQNRKFKISKSDNTLTLTPVDKNIAQAVDKIVVTLDENCSMAQTVAIHEKNGGKTVITFSNVQR